MKLFNRHVFDDDNLVGVRVHSININRITSQINKLIIVSDCFGVSHRCECININGTTIPTPLNAEKLLPPRVYLCWFDGLLLDVQIICCVSRNVIFGVHHSCILCFTPGPSAWNYIFLMFSNMICAETFGRTYCFLDHDCQYCYQHWFKVFSNWHMY